MYSVIGTDGQVYGPVDLNTLKGWCSQGRITPATNLIDAVSGMVVQANSIQDLYGAFNFQPPIAAPPQGHNQFQSPNVMMGQTPIQINNYVGPHAPMYSPAYSAPKSKAAAAILAFFLGALGVHRFYLGYNGIGVAMLLITVLTCGWGGIAMGVWAFVDMILILTGGLRDSQGQPLVG
jgi:hypothetical protein